jgi:hypothetical protein
MARTDQPNVDVPAPIHRREAEQPLCAFIPATTRMFVKVAPSAAISRQIGGEARA